MSMFTKIRLIANNDDADPTVFGKCKACDGIVVCYLCNESIYPMRPEANDWDWWVACSNPDCINNYGEGLFQDLIEWAKTL